MHRMQTNQYKDTTSCHFHPEKWQESGFHHHKTDQLADVSETPANNPCLCCLLRQFYAFIRDATVRKPEESGTHKKPTTALFSCLMTMNFDLLTSKSGFPKIMVKNFNVNFGDPGGSCLFRYRAVKQTDRPTNVAETLPPWLPSAWIKNSAVRKSLWMCHGKLQQQCIAAMHSSSLPSHKPDGWGPNWHSYLTGKWTSTSVGLTYIHTCRSYVHKHI